MTLALLDTNDDLLWLLATHLKGVPDVPPFKSALIAGNEDAPAQITLFADAAPSLLVRPVAIYRPDAAFEHYVAHFPLVDDPRR